MRSDQRRSVTLNTLLEFDSQVPGEEVAGGQKNINAMHIGPDSEDVPYPPTDARPGPLISGGGRASQHVDATKAFKLDGSIPGDLLIMAVQYICSGACACGSS